MTNYAHRKPFRKTITPALPLPSNKNEYSTEKLHNLQVQPKCVSTPPGGTKNDIKQPTASCTVHCL